MKYIFRLVAYNRAYATACLENYVVGCSVLHTGNVTVADSFCYFDHLTFSVPDKTFQLKQELSIPRKNITGMYMTFVALPVQMFYLQCFSLSASLV